MTINISANPIPAGQHFEVLTDDDNMDTAVFFLSEDNRLPGHCLSSAKPTRLECGQLSGLVPGGGKVQAFVVVQAPASTLDICVAMYRDDTHSNFFLLHSLSLGLLVPLRSQRPPLESTFSRLNTSSVGDGLLASLAQKEPDLSSLSTTKPRRWAAGPWLRTQRENIDVVLGTCTLGDGAFVLYESFTGLTHVQFKIFTGNTMIVEPLTNVYSTLQEQPVSAPLLIPPRIGASFSSVAPFSLPPRQASIAPPQAKEPLSAQETKSAASKTSQVIVSGQTLRFCTTLSKGTFVKYSKLDLTIFNFGAATLSHVLAKGEKADQPTIKRWKGTIAAVVAVPTICVALTQDIHKAEE
ncbi:hypothetical protein CCMA1212_006704 [Trichoderma ghanense]|uniref:Uncharacterized protein n=1 Tax=Trichoderma ghanense TaxID=65468 RepID=A0ABY2H0E5_9HYPO